jgi:hypothetical protein
MSQASIARILFSRRRMASEEATLEAKDVEDAAVDCDMHKHQAGGYRDQ